MKPNDPLRIDDKDGIRVEEKKDGTAVVRTDGLMGMHMPFSCFEAAQRWAEKVREMHVL